MMLEDDDPAHRATQPTASRRQRLDPVDKSAAYLPWQRAAQLSSCQLYWMPVHSYPIPFRQRQWLLRFWDEFSNTIAATRRAKAELFLQMKVIQPNLRDAFLRHSRQFSPVFGLSRRPGSALPDLPDEQYIQDLQKGRRSYDHKELQPDYCYWFLYKDEKRQREAFLGHGGLAAFYKRPDPETKAPKIEIPRRLQNDERFRSILAQFDLQRLTEGLQSLQSPFLKKSKEIFGSGLENELQYPGLLFIVPLFESTCFFEASNDDIQQWFSVFDICLTESPKDKGVLLASRCDIEDDLIVLLERLRQEGYMYPQ